MNLHAQFLSETKQRLAELGWTQERLAKELGLKQPNVAAILSGRHKPTLATVERIAKALNCSTTLRLPCDAAKLVSAKSGIAQTVADSLNASKPEGMKSAIFVEGQGDNAFFDLTELSEHTPYRTYIPEPVLKHDRTWIDKPPEQKAAVYANRRRTRGTRGKKLQRLRSERVERTFAHVCETGGARRTWLHGIDKLRKRYLIAAAAHNLGRLMRGLFGIGAPRGLQAFVDLWSSAYLTIQTRCRRVFPRLREGSIARDAQTLQAQAA